MLFCEAFFQLRAEKDCRQVNSWYTINCKVYLDSRDVKTNKQINNKCFPNWKSHTFKKIFSRKFFWRLMDEHDRKFYLFWYLGDHILEISLIAELLRFFPCHKRNQELFSLSFSVPSVPDWSLPVRITCTGCRKEEDKGCNSHRI